MLKKIVIKGAKEHNLKNISLEIPKDKFVVITGLSGSGKTFSVFGPDMIGMPEAWFNFDTPHKFWGIFPRLAYDIVTKEAPRRGDIQASG